MRKLASNLLLFCLPLAALLFFPMMVYVRSGESTSAAGVAKLQLSQNLVLFGRAYSNVDQQYKIAAANLRRPKIVAIGSSRAMNIRSEFFRTGESFYNAGVSGPKPDYLKRFFLSFGGERYPELAIVILDQRWFHEDFPRAFPLTDTDPALDHDPAWREFFRDAWRQIYVSYYRDKNFRHTQLSGYNRGAKRIGINATLGRHGYRNDGSFYYEHLLTTADGPAILRSEIARQVAQIDASAEGFEYGREMNESSLREVGEFLDYAREYGVTVIGVLPPYAPSIYDAIQMSTGDQKKNTEKIISALNAEFAQRSFAFYDLSRAELYGGSDEEFIDPVHGSDRMLARALLFLAQKNDDLAQVVDSTAIERSLSGSTDPRQIYAD